MNLKGYQKEVDKLAKAKGYDQETFYLFSRMIQEGSEMLDALWKEESDMEKRPNANIDREMIKKIASNYESLKKTKAKDGSMIRK